MSGLAEIVAAWSPLAHAPAAFLDRFDLPADVDPLCDWLYGEPGEWGTWRYGSAERVLCAAPVAPIGADLFEIDEAGAWAVLQPVAPDGDEITDVLAWHPCAPDRWRFLRGDGETLGATELELHDPARDGPMRVYGTPLGWIRAGGRGACLLRHDPGTARRVLLGHAELIVDTLEFGERLEAILHHQPALPAILVEEA